MQATNIEGMSLRLRRLQCGVNSLILAIILSACTGGTDVTTSSSSVPATVASAAPTSVVLSASPSTLNTGGTSSLSIQVLSGTEPVVDETVRIDISTNNSGASMSASSAVTDINGRISASYTAGSNTGIDTITVTTLTNDLSSTVDIGVDVASGGTGVPENIVIAVAESQISVAGVGQDENTSIQIDVLDGAGNKIEDPGTCSNATYTTASTCTAASGTWTSYNNVMVTLTSTPNGGEKLGGVDKSGNAVTPANSITIITSSGTAEASLQAGTISGVVEFQVDVLDSDETTVLLSSLVSQVVISSGPAHSINLTSPNLNSIENLGGGVYKRIGKVVVNDRYGNAVPDGTVVNLGIIDSVIAYDNDGALSSASATFTDADSLVSNTRQTNVGLDAVSIHRNGVERYIEANDRVLITNANAEDKSRIVALNSSTGNPTTLTAGTILTNKNYISVDHQGTAISTTGLDYLVGVSALGAQIIGETFDSAGLVTDVTGVAETKDGVATFYVTYPAREQTIHVGCGISGQACDTPFPGFSGSYPQTSAGCTAIGGNWVSYRDERYTPTDSAEVYVVASASESTTDSAVTIDRGQYCFDSIAPWTLEQPIDVTINSAGTYYVPQILREAGDVIPLPFVTVSAQGGVTNKGSGCFDGTTYQVDVAKDDCPGALVPGWTQSNIGLDLTDASCITDNPSTFSAGDGVSGSCWGAVVVTGSRLVPGDTAEVTWSAGDAETTVTFTYE